MGADGGFALYDIARANTPEIVTETARDYLASVLARWTQEETRDNELAQERPHQRDYWIEAAQETRAKIVALEAAIEAGDLMAILHECCYSTHLSDWGMCWWGPADKPPRACRIVRLSTGDNIPDEMYEVNLFMQSLCGQGVVDQLKDEETWT